MSGPHVDDTPLAAVRRLPGGRYGVAVSGGADSVALLLALADRRGQPGAPPMHLHVLHLDHETRGGASALDVEFVTALSTRLGLPCTVARLSGVERDVTKHRDVAPANRSARFRAARLALFGCVAEREQLDAVLLAHHRDDVAETVLLRLLRGSSWRGLAALRGESVVAGVRMLRPLLDCPAAALRAYLLSCGQAWREDASNADLTQHRNRARAALRALPEGVTEALVSLARACESAETWADGAAPQLPSRFACAAMARPPRALRESAARRWLVEVARVPPAEVERDEVDRLCAMALDAATPRQQMFPGGVVVRRRQGGVEVATA